MSFILDALRKSEHERQRQSGPGIADIAVARPGSRMPLALIAVGALLAVNLAVVLALLLRQGAPVAELAQEPAAVPAAQTPALMSGPEPPATAAGKDAPAPSPSLARAQAAAPAEPVREVRPLVEEATSSAALAESFEPPPAPDPSLLPAPPALPPTRTSPGSVVVAAPRADEFAPRIDTLPPQATAGLPALNLDLHIYATQPSQRAVFINGRRYAEGDALAEGAVVESITTDGAVVRYRGQRFLLPRQ